MVWCGDGLEILLLFGYCCFLLLFALLLSTDDIFHMVAEFYFYLKNPKQQNDEDSRTYLKVCESLRASSFAEIKF